MMDRDPDIDHNLLERLASGDASAFDMLFRKYWDHVFSAALLASKSVSFAEDVAQEVFLWVWKERLQMARVENLKAYLYRATRNFILRKLKRIKIEDTCGQSLLRQVFTTAPGNPETAATYKELHRFMEQGISKLPAQQQRAFRLSREKGMTHEAISREMGLSINSVKDYIVKSLAFLRKYLANYGEVWMVAFLVHLSKLFLLSTRPFY